MAVEKNEGLKGWLLFYIIVSIPVLMFYSAGLSGLFGYPIFLLFFLFLLFLIPVILILFKSYKAPQWNIAMLWIGVILLILRIVAVLVLKEEGESPPSQERLSIAVPILLGIVTFSIAWTIIWINYFKKSVRVRNTFVEKESQ